MKVSEKIFSEVKDGEILPSIKTNNEYDCGNSKIVSKNENSICFLRGKSKIYLKFDDINVAYENFKGKEISSKDLKEFNASVFNNKSCRATFFMQVLYRIGLAEITSRTAPYKVRAK